MIEMHGPEPGKGRRNESEGGRGALIIFSAVSLFSGVGKKVADCVALFCLDQFNAVPVDTHVWQIACRDYQEGLPGLADTKSLTDKVQLPPPQT